MSRLSPILFALASSVLLVAACRSFESASPNDPKEDVPLESPVRAAPESPPPPGLAVGSGASPIATDGAAPAPPAPPAPCTKVPLADVCRGMIDAWCYRIVFCCAEQPTMCSSSFGACRQTWRDEGLDCAAPRFASGEACLETVDRCFEAGKRAACVDARSLLPERWPSECKTFWSDHP